MKTEKKLISSKILFTAISEQLAEQRQAVFTVTGMSMWPFICHGRDQVVVGVCNSGSLKRGDIVLLQTPPGNYLLHRITKLKSDRFETTGDGNCFRDGYFPFSCIRAKVVKIIRKGKVIDCTSLGWKLIFRLWMFLYPIRKYIFCIWHYIRKYVK